MLKFFRESLLVQAFTPDPRSGAERLAASPWATATTPDQIIVAHILQSIAKDPDRWSWRYDAVLPAVDLKMRYIKRDNIPGGIRYGGEYYLKDFDQLLIRFIIQTNEVGGVYQLKATVVVKSGDKDAFILDTKSGDILTTRIGQLWEQMEKLRETAEKAKAAMEANELKWNVAEQLLGIQRPQG